jgi:selT/selW/selH-like putative selenoprotein
MQFEILYCKPCGYRERAEKLAVELRERFGAKASIREGGFGQFDVLLDGEVVASKGKLLRRLFVHGPPSEERIREAIEAALATREGDACAIPPAAES